MDVEDDRKLGWELAAELGREVAGDVVFEVDVDATAVDASEHAGVSASESLRSTLRLMRRTPGGRGDLAELSQHCVATVALVDARDPVPSEKASLRTLSMTLCDRCPIEGLIRDSRPCSTRLHR